MRLLNTTTLQLVDFLESDIPLPPYAILSHTWGTEEVTFQEMQYGYRHPTDSEDTTTKQKAGYTKIRKSSELARKSEFEYIWIDTCCINKESSAEHSEAINSMYHYYRNSVVCYVYLVDVSLNHDNSGDEEDPRSQDSMFRRCRWFTRGWTLQELLAPSEVIFLDKNWVEIGTKTSLRDLVEKA